MNKLSPGMYRVTKSTSTRLGKTQRAAHDEIIASVVTFDPPISGNRGRRLTGTPSFGPFSRRLATGGRPEPKVVVIGNLPAGTVFIGKDDTLVSIGPDATQQLIDSRALPSANDQKEAMRRSAVEAVLGNSEWLTATQVSHLTNPFAKNPHAIASRLLSSHRVFALERRGVKIFPRYLFDAAGSPIPVAKKVLARLEGYSPFRIAAWFESTSSALNGRRPREVLETNAKEVIAAAEEHVHGALYG